MALTTISPVNSRATVSNGLPIIVIGDVAIDWLAAPWKYSGDPGHRAWLDDRQQVQMVAMMSGAWLLESFMLRLGPSGLNPHRYYCYERPIAMHGQGAPSDVREMRRTADPRQILHTFSEMFLFDRGVPAARLSSHGCPWAADLGCDHRGKEHPQKVYRFTDRPRFFGPIGDDPREAPSKDRLRCRRAGTDDGPLDPDESFDPPFPKMSKDQSVEEYRKTVNQVRDLHQEKLNSDLRHRRLLVILDGAQQVFRNRDERWTDLIPDKHDPDVHIVLFQRPKYPGDGNENRLWDRLQNAHAERLTVVVTANSLRREGIIISKSLSWEQTALDFCKSLGTDDRLNTLAKAKHLVIRFGSTGAIHIRRNRDCPDPTAKIQIEDLTATLHYHPAFVEGEYRDQNKYGRMPGMSALLTAAIARELADGLTSRSFAFGECVDTGIRAGMLFGHQLFCHGFGCSDVECNGQPASVLNLETEDRWNHLFRTYSPTELERSQLQRITFDASQYKLDILEATIGNDKAAAEQIGKRIVIEGIERALNNPPPDHPLRFPVARFGNYWVVDRREIESFRSIRNLLQEHREKRPVKPLSIAVFGPAGSGKSFGVKEIIKSLGGKEGVEFITCNLAQLTSSIELSQALLPVREVALDGKLAVVFFDEFDAKFGSDDLAWLRFFLPIMQDGVFKHGEGVLKVGGAVFVFAGGTSRNYDVFCREDKDSNDQDRKRFKDVKGPDFVSRLRGYVNIRGIDPDASGEGAVYVIRRAITLRSLIAEKYRSLFADRNPQNRLKIDERVIHALLSVGKYVHGVRSLEAVLDMSRLAGATEFDASRLPLDEQLAMHVENVEQFVAALWTTAD